MPDKITGKGYMITKPVEITREDLFNTWKELSYRFSRINVMFQNAMLVDNEEAHEWSDSIDQILYETKELQALSMGYFKHHSDNRIE